jgi:nucleotidyltransferase substrate binding protein (TIGR01987 family)
LKSIIPGMKKGSKTSSFGTSSRISHDSSQYYNSRLYAGLQGAGDAAPLPDNPFPSEYENHIILGNAVDMKEIPDRSLHLMITSPPYNVTKEYDENLSLQEYLDLLRQVFSETYRALVHGGRACVNVANLGRRPYIPLSDLISHLMIDIGFLMRGEIIWNKGAGAGVSMAWGSWQSAANPVLRDTHEYVLVFSKGAFGRKKTPGKENTISREQFMEWTKSVWTINPESASKVGHPAPFPVELPYRLIQLYTFKGEAVLDPFMGSGSTALAALKSDRKYIGYEIDPEYVKIAEARISRFPLLRAHLTSKSNLWRPLMIDEDIRWIQRSNHFAKALSQLKDAVELSRQRSLSKLEEQGLIQAFEYTHELAWNTLKDFLESRGVTNLYGSKDATREAFRTGLIENGEVWMEMINSRNLTSHTYNEDTAEQIVSAILTTYFREYETLQDKLEHLKQAELE